MVYIGGDVVESDGEKIRVSFVDIKDMLSALESTKGEDKTVQKCLFFLCQGSF